MGPNNPLQIFKAIQRYARIPLRRWSPVGKPAAVVLGLSPWDEFVAAWLPDRAVTRRDRKFSPYEFYTSIAPLILDDRRTTVYVWGYKSSPYVEAFCRWFGVPIVRIEDGFLRSVALGATNAPPLSLCFDSSVLYYDPSEQSDLEKIIQTYDFAGDQDLMARARSGMHRLLTTRLSKYNISRNVDIEAFYGPKTARRILVIGQVDGDMSIVKGCAMPMTNNRLVEIAHRENPGAQIIYKPHPEVLAGTRRDPPQSDPAEVRHLAMVVQKDIALADALETVDHVYTMTSLAGFEALLRGIKVTCLGMPFYAGWGLTDDRQACPRRTARRTVVELFGAAYILYPRYFDPYAKRYISFEEALALLHALKRDYESTARAGTARG